jgi:hypothetical protein
MFRWLQGHCEGVSSIGVLCDWNASDTLDKAFLALVSYFCRQWHVKNIDTRYFLSCCVTW